MLEKIKGWFKKEEVEQSPEIHPEFSEPDAGGYWRWNHTNFLDFKREKAEAENRKCVANSIIPNFKIAFGFDDPAILENCPFMGKIGESDEEGSKYWGVFYGNKEDFEALKSWAGQFTDKVRLLDYESERSIEIDPNSSEEDENVKWLGNKIIILNKKNSPIKKNT